MVVPSQFISVMTERGTGTCKAATCFQGSWGGDPPLPLQKDSFPQSQGLLVAGKSQLSPCVGFAPGEGKLSYPRPIPSQGPLIQ